MTSFSRTRCRRRANTAGTAPQRRNNARSRVISARIVESGRRGIHLELELLGGEPGGVIDEHSGDVAVARR
ncbi:MAG: hypothetical protein IPH03_11675 [Tetrasphaera sp.]|nr:hypothetical protein [Tetrasphaera sp.]